jgi:hypothetical protein
MQPSGGSFRARRYALADRKTVLMPAAARLIAVGFAIGITVTRPTDSSDGLADHSLVTPDKATPDSADTSLQDCKAGHPSAKENGCSCIEAAGTSTVLTERRTPHYDATDGGSG